MSYSRKRKVWAEQNRLPAPKASDSGESSTVCNERLQNRPLEWCLAHQKLTKDGKWEVDPKKTETVRVVQKVVSIYMFN